MNIRLIAPACLAILVLSMALPGYGQNRIDPINQIQASAFTLHVDGDLLFVGGNDRVRIYNIADRSNPTFVGDYTVAADVSTIATVDNLMIVGLIDRNIANRNLFVVDISNPASPVELSGQRVGENGMELRVVKTVGRTILAGVQNEALYAIGLTPDNKIDPNILDILAMSPDEEIYDMEIKGNRAYLATFWDIIVVDISDVSNLQTVVAILTEDLNNAISIDGNLMATAYGGFGIQFYDITNPDQPSPIRNVFLSGENQPLDVFIREEFAYVAQPYYIPPGSFIPNQGGLRIVDYQQMNNAREVFSYTFDGDSFKVIAYDGFVYLASNGTVDIFEHGPKGARPTATPIIPTNTPTPTSTPTPTNTPPTLNTPTPLPGGPTATFTPTHTATFTATSTLPSQASPTFTPPSQPTPTPTQPGAATSTPTHPPITGLPNPIFVSDFDGPFLGNEEFAVQLPFSGAFVLGQNSIGTIPTDNAFAGATNGRGLITNVNVGEAVTYIGPFRQVDPGVPVLLRVSARATGPGATLAIAALDGSFDGSVATNIPANSQLFVGAYKRFVLLYKPPTHSIIPILQVTNTAGPGPVTVYFDNFEMIPLPSGTLIPADALGADGTAP